MLKLTTLLLTLPATALAAPQNGAPGAAGPGGGSYEAQVFYNFTHGPDGEGAGPCQRQAWAQRKADVRGAQADFVHDLAVCVNVSDADDRWECVLEAFESLDEALEELQEQFLARLDLCQLLGGDTYEPEIDPEDFVDVIDNPFLPLTPGTTRVYEKQTDEGLEVVHVKATDATREIMGVECLVVRDTEWLDGELEEDTFDYFAQDVAGNVWYFGELSFEYEDGQISGLEGSWIAGEDGAHPGILMAAAPQVGQTQRQEFLLGEAEDVGTVLDLNAAATVPFGNFVGCVQTLDFTPLEPDAEEEKYYAAGVGTVLEVDLENGERLELVDVIVD